MMIMMMNGAKTRDPQVEGRPKIKTKGSHRDSRKERRDCCTIVRDCSPLQLDQLKLLCFEMVPHEEGHGAIALDG
jgi:hypothetical protein